MDINYSNTITVSDYNNLRKSAGWGEFNERQAQAGINNSKYLVAAYQDNAAVGMARLISDGGCVIVILDVVVLPEYQKKGIGKTMMKMIMSFIESNLNSDDTAYIALMAAKGKEDFYKKFGFNERPDELHGAGMTQWITKKN